MTTNELKAEEPLTLEVVKLEYKRFYEINPEIANFYSKCINFMQRMVQDAFVEDVKGMKTKKTGASAISELYEINILHEFIAHEILLKNGVCYSSYNHLRSIYEGILKIYLNKTSPELGELNFKIETIESDKELSEEEKKEIKQKYWNNNHLNTSFVERKLYSEEIRNLLRKFYGKICKIVHPSIESLASCFNFRPDAFKDSLQLGIGLTICNFIIIFELYKDKIKTEHKKELLKMIPDFEKYIPEGIPVLIPTINKENLHIKSYEEFIGVLRE